MFAKFETPFEFKFNSDRVALVLCCVMRSWSSRCRFATSLSRYEPGKHMRVQSLLGVMLRGPLKVDYQWSWLFPSLLRPCWGPLKRSACTTHININIARYQGLLPPPTRIALLKRSRPGFQNGAGRWWGEKPSQTQTAFSEFDTVNSDKEKRGMKTCQWYCETSATDE